MGTASSQAATCAAFASAAEYTATVRMRSRRAVRATRQAISPRFAMSSFANTGSGLRNPGGRTLLEERRDAFAPFGRDARIGNAFRGGGEQYVVHRRLDHIGQQALGR